MVIPLKVREIESLKHESNECISMSLYFSRIELRNHPIYAHIFQKLHLVKGLKANLLVGNNILATERVIIDFANKTTIILSYQVIISVTTQSIGYPVQKKVLVDKSFTIFPETETLVQFVCSGFPNNWDFFFNPTPYGHLTLFLHIFNGSTHKVLVWNELHQPIFLLHHQ